MTHSEQPSLNTPAQRWAWIAGASEGLGLAFAEELARRGYCLLLFARRGQLLATEAARLRARYGISTICEAMDLGAADLAARLIPHLETTPPSVAIYNAAFAPVGDFIEQPLEDLQKVVDINVRGPLIWSRLIGESMRRRGRGALIFMSSLAGEQGSPRISAYAASKSFSTILAEGLWGELQAGGVEVLVCTAGAVRTPGYQGTTASDAPGILDAAALAIATLNGIGKGPRVTPGWVNRIAALLLGRWLPRRLAIALMARNTRMLESASSTSRPESGR